MPTAANWHLRTIRTARTRARADRWSPRCGSSGRQRQRQDKASPPFRVGRRQPPAPDVHLDRRVEQPGNLERRVASLAHVNIGILVDRTADVDIALTLLAYGRLPRELLPTGGLVIVAGE